MIVCANGEGGWVEGRGRGVGGVGGQGSGVEVPQPRQRVACLSNLPIA